MRILVTGATGFVGNSLITHLSAQNVQLKAVVRNKSSQLPSAIEQVVIPDLATLSSSASLDELKSALKETDVVVHTAALAHVMNNTASDPLEGFRKINRDASLTLAKIALNEGVSRFIFISSIGVNGNNNKQPFLETDKPNPQEYYAISKCEAEIELLKLAKKTEMEVVIIRPPLVYGFNAPGNFGSLIKWVNKGIPLPFGAVHNKRSLVALDNLVDFIALCADSEKSPKAANQVFLISDGEDVSTTQLLRKVAKAFNKKAWLIPVPVSLMTFAAKLIGKGEVANRLFGSLQVDSSKAKTLLGWRPVVTMDEQLRKIVNQK